MEALKKTSLYDNHKENGGKIINFSGWALPVEYEGIMAEHEAVRNAAGLFDVSHMGEVKVGGNQAFEYIQNLITNDISSLKDNQAIYTLMCYPDGGIVDDLLVYKFSKDHYLLVINASNIEKDLKWMKDHMNHYDVEVINISDDVSEIAIQGPKAEEILQKTTDTKLSELKFFHCKANVKIAGANCLISRTGYTGEDGFEIYLKHNEASKVWNELLSSGKEMGIKPAGLGARDTLRFEAGLPLYGNELSQDITPLEAGLGFFTKLDKGDFVGKDALQAQKKEGVKRKIVGFEMEEKGIPRHEYEVLSDGSQIGSVTTGYFSPTLKKNIGLAMVDVDFTAVGTPIEIKIRKRILKAKVISKKFYQRNYKK